MTPSTFSHTFRVAGATVLLASLLLVASPGQATAEPDRPAQSGSSRQQLAAGSMGDTLITLEADTYAIPSNSPYSFTSTVSTTDDTDSVFMRLKVFNPSGRLMTQRTQIVNDPGKGTATATFERRTDDLSLSPGAYPVQLEVSVSENGRTERTTLSAELLIFDSSSDPLPVAIAVRISGQPLADPQGRFVADPGQFTRPRDDTAELSRWVLGDADARLTLALSPLLLEEWKRISQGYEFAGPEGVSSIPASSTVPVAYAQTLQLLRSALGTGRMELTSQGLTDPDLSELSHAKMIADVTPQYAEGVSAVFASIESTPSTGTAPAGGCLPPDAVGPIAEGGVGYVMLSPACTRSGSETATTGLYVVEDSGLKALVSDPLAGVAIRDSTPADLLRRAYDVHLESDSEPLVIGVNVGVGHATASSVIVAADRVSAQQWLRLQPGREIASESTKRSIEVVARKASKGVPAGYWDDVREARTWAEALSAALGDGDPSAATARRDSLVAQCSAWADPSNEWALADRGRTFADTATRLATSVLETVSIRAESVTLAGSEGNVPVTLTNGSESALTLTLKATPAGGVRTGGDARQTLELPPQDTFVEIPVAMPDSLSGTLMVSVMAGDLVLQTETVAIRASYLDRLVMIVGVVIVLAGLLFIVVRRVRAVPNDDAGPRGSTSGERSDE